MEETSNIKDHPPCGAVTYLAPRTRGELWDAWLQAFKIFADAQPPFADALPDSEDPASAS
eukprot:16440891-Heterocapsa_arctica.AAC.1